MWVRGFLRPGLQDCLIELTLSKFAYHDTRMTNTNNTNAIETLSDSQRAHAAGVLHAVYAACALLMGDPQEYRLLTNTRGYGDKRAHLLRVQNMFQELRGARPVRSVGRSYVQLLGYASALRADVLAMAREIKADAATGKLLEDVEIEANQAAEAEALAEEIVELAFSGAVEADVMTPDYRPADGEDHVSLRRHVLEACESRIGNWRTDTKSAWAAMDACERLVGARLARKPRKARKAAPAPQADATCAQPAENPVRGKCYACDADAVGLRDRRPEGHAMEKACARHADPTFMFERADHGGLRRFYVDASHARYSVTFRQLEGNAVAVAEVRKCGERSWHPCGKAVESSLTLFAYNEYLEAQAEAEKAARTARPRNLSRRFPEAVWAWLHRNGGRCLWSQVLEGSPHSTTIDCWMVGRGLVIVTYGEGHWELYSHAQSNSIPESLADAAQRVGATK